MRRYPTSAEVERVAEALCTRPRLPSDLARVTRMPYRRITAALRALPW